VPSPLPGTVPELDERLKQMDLKISRYKQENQNFAKQLPSSDGRTAVPRLGSVLGQQMQTATAAWSCAEQPAAKEPLNSTLQSTELQLFESRSPTMPNFPANQQTQLPALQLKPAHLSLMKTQPRSFHPSAASPDADCRHAKTSLLVPDRSEENERLSKIVQEQRAVIHQMQALLLEERAKNSRHNSSSRDKSRTHYSLAAGGAAHREDKSDEQRTDLDALYRNFVKRIQGWERIKQGRSRPPSQTGASMVSRIQDSSRDSDRMTSKSTTKRISSRVTAKQERLKSNNSRTSCSKKQPARQPRDASKQREGRRPAARRNSQASHKRGQKANKTLQARANDTKPKPQASQTRAKPAHPRQAGLASRKVMHQIADLVVDIVGKQLVSKSKATSKAADREKKR
jgi:hypothetical protein